MASPVRGGPPPINSSYAPRRFGQAKDEHSDDEEMFFMDHLRKVEKVIAVDDEESRDLLRLATQVPKFATAQRTVTTVTSSQTRTVRGQSPKKVGFQLERGGGAAPDFDSIDANKDGVITRREFQGALRAEDGGGATIASSSYGPPGRNDHLASIYNRANDAYGSGAAPVAHVLPAEARWLPPSTRIAELEGGVLDLLMSLLQQEQQNMDFLKQRAAAQADTSVAHSRRAPAESELNFRRLSTNRAPFTVEKPAGVIEAELSSLATALLSMPPMGQRAGMMPTSQIPAQVEGLITACHRHLSTVYRGDKNSVRGLNALREIGQLLTEVERDTQSMAMALAAGTGDAAERWAARLGSVSKGLRPSMPDMESLAHQLEMENDLIREALKRPVPEALLQAPSRHLPAGFTLR